MVKVHAFIFMYRQSFCIDLWFVSLLVGLSNSDVWLKEEDYDFMIRYVFLKVEQTHLSTRLVRFCSLCMNNPPVLFSGLMWQVLWMAKTKVMSEKSERVLDISSDFCVGQMMILSMSVGCGALRKVGSHQKAPSYFSPWGKRKGCVCLRLRVWWVVDISCLAHCLNKFW